MSAITPSELTDRPTNEPLQQTVHSVYASISIYASKHMETMSVKRYTVYCVISFQKGLIEDSDIFAKNVTSFFLTIFCKQA